MSHIFYHDPSAEISYPRQARLIPRNCYFSLLDLFKNLSSVDLTISVQSLF